MNKCRNCLTSLELKLFIFLSKLVEFIYFSETLLYLLSFGDSKLDVSPTEKICKQDVAIYILL